MTYVREHNPWVDSAGQQVKATTMNGIDAALTTLFGVAPTTNGAMVWDGTQFRADAGIKNANVDAAAAIASTKIDFTGGNALTNAAIAGAAAIARSKLDFGSGLVNADISATAAIALSKLASNVLGGVALATTLPGSPTDGQFALFTDSTSAPTYVWLLMWVSAASKWVFVGGSPQWWQVGTLGSGGQFQTTSGSYVDVTGATLTVPRSGVYLVEAGGYTGKEFSTDAGQVGWAININGSVVGEQAIVYTQASYAEVGGVNKTLKQTLTSGWVVKLQAKSNGAGNVKLEDHFIKLTPVTVT